MKTQFPEDDDDKVGYGKPPKQFQFKKGQSGNAKGRPKKNKSVKEQVNEALDVTIRHGDKRITKREALITSLVNDAIKGKASARNTVLGLLGDEDSELEDFDSSFDDQIEWLKTQGRMASQIQRKKGEGEQKAS